MFDIRIIAKFWKQEAPNIQQKYELKRACCAILSAYARPSSRPESFPEYLNASEFLEINYDISMKSTLKVSGGFAYDVRLGGYETRRFSRYSKAIRAYIEIIQYIGNLKVVGEMNERLELIEKENNL